jgi:uncharacterized protein YlaI
MKYKLDCPFCKKRIRVSTRDRVEYIEDGLIVVYIPCPECKSEIELNIIRRNRI